MHASRNVPEISDTPNMLVEHTQTINNYHQNADPSFLGRHSAGAVKLGAVVIGATVVAGALHGMWKGLPGINQDHGHITTEVEHVAPLDLDCMGIMTAHTTGHVRTKLAGLFGGFKADITADTESLLCMHKDGVNIQERPDGSTYISIDAARSAVIFTRMREDTRNQNSDNAHGISEMGDGIGGQLDAIGISFIKDHDHKQQASLSKYLAVKMVNEAEQCANQLSLPAGSGTGDAKTAALLLPASTAMGESVLHQIYQTAYEQDVVRAHRDPSKLTLTIKGIPDYKQTYTPDYKSSIYKLTKFERSADCVIPTTALDFKINDLQHQAEAK